MDHVTQISHVKQKRTTITVPVEDILAAIEQRGTSLPEKAPDEIIFHPRHEVQTLAGVVDVLGTVEIVYLEAVSEEEDTATQELIPLGPMPPEPPEPPAPPPPNEYDIFADLCYVMDKPPAPEVIASWTQAQKDQAMDWANARMRKENPSRPDFLKTLEDVKDERPEAFEEGGGVDSRNIPQ